MKNYKTIHEILGSWGRGKRETPLHNDVLKEKVLLAATSDVREKISFSPRRIAWLPFAFSAMALLVFAVNMTGYSNSKSFSGIAEENVSYSPAAPAYDMNKSAVSISMPPFYGDGGSPISDNREFSKINYNATLRTRRISELQMRVETI